MVAMLNSARRLKKKLKDRVKKTRHRQAKRYAVALRSSEIAMRQATRAAGLWQPEVVEDLVVSLTSFPVRIGKLHRVIRGLLAQSLQPGKIVLYLSLGGVSGSSVAERAHGADKRSLRDPLRGRQSAPLQEAALRACRFSPGNDPHRRRRQSLSVRLPSPLVAGLRGKPANGHMRARPLHADPRQGDFALHGLEGHTIVQAELHDLPGGGWASFILPDRSIP